MRCHNGVRSQYVAGKLKQTVVKSITSLQVSVIDTEIVLTVSIPIVTNGLVIEFNEVADARGSSEVHCPR